MARDAVLWHVMRCCSQKGTIDALLLQEHEMPLIGREADNERFLAELRNVKNQSSLQRQLIVLRGESGVGKSRLLDSLIVMAVRQEIRSVAVRQEIRSVVVFPA